MFTQQNKNSSRKIVLLVVVAVGCAVLASCQSYPYSKVENEVYNYVDKLSLEIPNGFLEDEKKTEGSSETYSYHDASLDMEDTPWSGEGRWVRYKLYYGYEELGAGYLNADDLTRWIESEGKDTSELKPNSISIVIFLAMRPTRVADEKEVLKNEWFVLQKTRDIAMYFKETGSNVWKKCELYGAPRPFGSESFQECEQRAKIVPAEKVQRYVKLAKRLDNTYSFPKEPGH